PSHPTTVPYTTLFRSEAEHDPGIHHDPVLVEHLDLVLKLLHAVKGFVRLLQTVLVERLHAHEDRDTTALGRQLDHLRVVAQEQRGLASPLNLERLERLPQLPAVAPVAVMQVIHEREDGSVL